MPQKSPIGTVVMNLLLAVLLAMSSWTVVTTHQNRIMLADLQRMVHDGKDQRVIFTEETKVEFKQHGEKLTNLDVRVTALETKVTWGKP